VISLSAENSGVAPLLKNSGNPLAKIKQALTEDSETAASLSELRDRAVQHTEAASNGWKYRVRSWRRKYPAK